MVTWGVGHRTDLILKFQILGSMLYMLLHFTLTVCENDSRLLKHMVFSNADYPVEDPTNRPSGSGVTIIGTYSC